jgi:dTDP-4-dehydrorhamnose reductase
MRLLVLGGWGQLGSDLVAAAGDHEVARPRRAEVDVTDPAAVRAAVGDWRPDVVIDLAAFHRLDRCEAEPEAAFAVNAVGARHVARAAVDTRARCVYVSTDYVFDGTSPAGYAEDDPVAPLNVYGASKAAGERLVRMTSPDSLVVRASGLFGHAGSSGKGGNFVETMLAKAAASEEIRVVDDLVFSPTATHDLADAMVALLERDAPPGTYHLANGGRCSWFAFARRILDLAGVEARLVARKDSPDGIARPRCSVLVDTKRERLGLGPARPWEEALAWYLANRPRVGALRTAG